MIVARLAEGQEIAARNFYRPIDSKVAAQHAAQFPKIALFTIEQLVNGWRHGFEGPEDRDDLPQFVAEEIAE